MTGRGMEEEREERRDDFKCSELFVDSVCPFGMVKAHATFIRRLFNTWNYSSLHYTNIIVIYSQLAMTNCIFWEKEFWRSLQQILALFYIKWEQEEEKKRYSSLLPNQYDFTWTRCGEPTEESVEIIWIRWEGLVITGESDSEFWIVCTCKITHRILIYTF